MNDPNGMRFGERVGNLHGMLGGVAGVHRSARDHRLQRLSRHELEDEKDATFVFADFVQGRDVGM